MLLPYSYKVSHVLFLKRGAAIYLSVSRFQSRFPCLSSASNSPTEFGFLAYGVYLVPLRRFPAGIVTVALLKSLIHSQTVGSKSSRQIPLPGLIASSGANTTSNRSLCEHGLSSDLYNQRPHHLYEWINVWKPRFPNGKAALKCLSYSRCFRLCSDPACPLTQRPLP